VRCLGEMQKNKKEEVKILGNRNRISYGHKESKRWKPKDRFYTRCKNCLTTKYYSNNTPHFLTSPKTCPTIKKGWVIYGSVNFYHWVGGLGVVNIHGNV